MISTLTFDPIGLHASAIYLGVQKLVKKCSLRLLYIYAYLSMHINRGLHVVLNPVACMFCNLFNGSFEDGAVMIWIYVPLQYCGYRFSVVHIIYVHAL